MTPFRLRTLHLLQIRLTEALTFIASVPNHRIKRPKKFLLYQLRRPDILLKIFVKNPSKPSSILRSISFLKTFDRKTFAICTIGFFIVEIFKSFATVLGRIEKPPLKISTTKIVFFQKKISTSKDRLPPKFSQPHQLCSQNLKKTASIVRDLKPENNNPACRDISSE